MDHTGFSPRVQQKIVYAGVASVSYQKASEHLAELSDLAVKPKPVERLVQRIGQERIDQRDAAVAAHQRLPLMAKDAIANPERPSPAVAMVSVDGGRLQVRPEPLTTSESEAEAASESEAEAASESASESEAEAESKRTSHWRESKVAVLETYRSEVHAVDPDPHVPRCFLDLKRTAKVVRGSGHAVPVGLSFDGASQAQEPEQGQDRPQETGRRRAARPGRPERLVRSVLASRSCSDDFAPMMHQAAWERNFFGAARRVFLGDGLPVNWTIQQRHFSTSQPVLDFVHALSYVFAAAFAGRPQDEGGAVYRRWIQAVWSGQVATILPELEARLAVLGSPPVACAETDPRWLVFEALRYLRNNADRMRYDEYRRQGLPIMTSAVESVIKQINQRVKGSEKFWSEPGAESILQLRADYLSETEIMSRFWSAREGQARSGRPYRRAA
jgi:hypothetical protein